MKILDFLSDKELENNIEKIKLSRKNLDEKWELCDKAELDCDEVSFLENELREDLINHLSIYLMVNKLDSIIDRKENKQYDVTKIKISNKLNDKMKDYDFKVYSSFFKDMYTEEKIKKDISMLHFMSGFSIDEKLDDLSLHILDDVLKEK